MRGESRHSGAGALFVLVGLIAKNAEKKKILAAQFITQA